MIEHHKKIIFANQKYSKIIFYKINDGDYDDDGDGDDGRVNGNGYDGDDRNVSGSGSESESGCVPGTRFCVDRRDFAELPELQLQKLE